SIGWAIGSPITAWVVEKFGYSFIGPAFVVSMGIGWLTIAGIKDVNKVHTSEPLNFSDVRQLLKNKAYVIVVVILFLFFIVDMVQSYSVVDKVWYLGGSERDIGNYWLLAAMMELPVFFFGGKLIQRFGAAKLMIASGFFYAVRYAIFGMATSVTHVFIGGALQGVTYPLLMISSKIMVDEQSPDNMKTSGQQVAGSIYNCGGALITPVMVGLLEDGLGINPSLYAIAALAMIPTILLVFVNRSGKSASR
ncbi:MAG: MFS transporter, partial [Erysipelotrichaceae bacterium]|nr:MFS transporter [Erysipelotrichaceae bacterium]